MPTLEVNFLTPKVKPVSPRFGGYPSMPIGCPSRLPTGGVVQPEAFHYHHDRENFNPLYK